ncbi:uncharacterized protein LOC124144018 [Haliotis rufescens]|uniref:uncharacterized protein LOC124144018 n=1 Tax=Haliotis rufescens TaxID=6454 RepID=UPI001EAFA2F0|nr:uncharacterized protein LOC124144018 [Haliotis rufescens]
MNRILQTVLVTFQVACCVLAANIRQAPALHPPVKAGRNNDPLNARHCIEEWASGETEIGFNFPQAKQILGVTLDNIRNRMQCIRDTTYGVTGNTVWVSNGCQAEVTICYEVSPGPIVPRVNDPAFKVEAFPGTASPLPAVPAPAMTEPGMYSCTCS